MPTRCAVLIDLPTDNRFHVATLDALRHAGAAAHDRLDLVVIGTDDPALAAAVAQADGVVIGPGSPYRDPAAAEAAITACRDRQVPLLAT